MATQLNQAQAQNFDKLPSQTVENLRNVSAITLRSGKNIEVPTSQPTPPKEADPTTLQRKCDAHAAGPSTSGVTSTPSTSTAADVTPPSPIAPSSPSPSPSPLKGPITRSMMKKIQKGLPLDDHKINGLLTFFTWAKEITKT